MPASEPACSNGDLSRAKIADLPKTSVYESMCTCGSLAFGVDRYKSLLRRDFQGPEVLCGRHRDAISRSLFGLLEKIFDGLGASVVSVACRKVGDDEVL